MENKAKQALVAAVQAAESQVVSATSAIQDAVTKAQALIAHGDAESATVVLQRAAAIKRNLPAVQEAVAASRTAMATLPDQVAPVYIALAVDRSSSIEPEQVLAFCNAIDAAIRWARAKIGLDVSGVAVVTFANLQTHDPLTFRLFPANRIRQIPAWVGAEDKYGQGGWNGESTWEGLLLAVGQLAELQSKQISPRIVGNFPNMDGSQGIVIVLTDYEEPVEDNFTHSQAASYLPKNWQVIAVADGAHEGHALAAVAKHIWFSVEEAKATFEKAGEYSARENPVAVAMTSLPAVQAAAQQLQAITGLQALNAATDQLRQLQADHH